MSLSTSQYKLKFLFDENVDKRLEKFLKEQGIDAVSKPKRVSNGMLAEFSKSEQRILVTNDEDFTEFAKEKVFSLLWLRVPQHKIDSLIREFSKLIEQKTEVEDFEGNLITLYEHGFKISKLSNELGKDNLAK